MISNKNKKQEKIVYVLAVTFLFSGVFLFTPAAAHAGLLSDWFGNTVGSAFKGLLYGIFVMVGWFASMAITLFEWAISPNYISGPDGLLNRASLYTMWKMIRDFFNLFFILTLLYTAFTIVFQVASNYKKTLLSIVLAALFVNFSFPITRVIIDIGNVPMYYFANQLAGAENNKKTLGTVLSASQLQEILIPGAGTGISEVKFEKVGVSQILMGIVFLFIFSITLLVLAVMFVIRLAALVILLIFSSVGFAASVIPGLEKYSKTWWEKLTQYVLFGPAAMLMLVVATRFFAEISKDNTKKQFLDAAVSNSSPESAGFVSAMAMFTIPIAMLWMAIGISSKFSIMGSDAVVGKGKAFAKWAGKRTYNNTLTRGIGGGIKTRFSESRAGRYLARPSGIETFAKGATKGVGSEKGWRGGVATEREKVHQKQVNEQVKKNKENQVSDSTHVNNLESNDRVEREAAALSLAESKGLRSADTLAKAIAAVGDNNDAVAKILDNARPEAISGINTAQDGNIRNAFYEKDATGKAKTDKDGNGIIDQKMRDSHDAYNSRLKKEGNLKVRVDYEIARKMNEKRAAGPLNSQKEGEARTEVYEDLIGRLGADDLAKQGSIHSAIATDNDLKNYLKEKVDDEPKFYQEAFKKMSKTDRDKWTENGVSPEVQGKQADEGARLREKMQRVKKEHGR